MGLHRRISVSQGGNLEPAPQNCLLNAAASGSGMFDMRAGSLATIVGQGSITSDGSEISPHPTRPYYAIPSASSVIVIPNAGSPTTWTWDDGFTHAVVVSAEQITLSVSGTVNCAAWGAHGRYLAGGHATTPFLDAWIIHDEAAKSTAMTLSANPAGAVNGAAWSPDNRFLAVAHTTTPFVTIYEQTAPTTLTKLANPAALPGGQGMSVAWHPSGDFVAIGSQTTTPFLRIYDMRTGAPVASTLSAQPSTGVVTCCFSPCGSYLFAEQKTANRALVYERTADATFTKNTVTYAPANDSTAVGQIVSHPNGKFVTIGWATTSPFHNAVVRQGVDLIDAGTLSATPSAAPSFGVHSHAHMQVPRAVKRRLTHR